MPVWGAVLFRFDLQGAIHQPGTVALWQKATGFQWPFPYHKYSFNLLLIKWNDFKI